MRIVRTKKNFYRSVLFLTLLSAVLCLLPGRARAYNSEAWKKLLAERTAVLWHEGQFFGEGIVLNARGELNVVWLERGLNRVFARDREADEWVREGANYYLSNRKETQAKLKGHDVFALRFRAIKSWSFDPAMLTIDGYSITPEDVLTRREYWEGTAPPGYVGTVVVAGPQLKAGQTVEVRYGDAAAQFTAPGRAR